MSYENAPATTMLATHCAVCRRALLDSISVECGIGPVCRQTHGYDEEVAALGDDARQSANRIVAQVARKGVTEGERAAACAALRVMGFKKLADRVEYRGKDAPRRDDAVVSVVEYELPALPGSYRRGRYLRPLPARKGYLVRAPYRPAAVEAFRLVRGRRWLAEQRATFVPADAKVELWALLRAHYPGLPLVTSTGQAVIPNAA